MTYPEIKQAIFIKRPNRFIAIVDLDGKEETVHVKNTGRCKEILVAGAKVYLEKGRGENRKTAWSLIAVEKEERLINIDSQAPNKIVSEALLSGQLMLDGLKPKISMLKPESTFGSSRFDFYYEAENVKGYIEVKGVTLERSDIMLFPDAPTIRGTRHLTELIAATRQGFCCYAIFVIQMAGGLWFTPNHETDPDFTLALHNAQAGGVHLMAVNCLVTPDTITAANLMKIKLD